MFRRLPNQLPPDPVVPAELTKLGYFITENDQIRQIRNPSQMFQVRVNRNERVNEVYKNAMNTCVHNIVRDRLLDLGLEQIRLPLGTAPSDQHVPILVSKGLDKKKHVIVLFTDRHSEPGILSYRVTGNEGINEGSLVNFVKAVLYRPESKIKYEETASTSEPDALPPIIQEINIERPGLIVANASQLLWYRGGGRAVTDREWMSLPRQSAVHQPFRIDEVKNRIPENRTFQEHVQYIFENILSTSAEDETAPICNPDAKFSIVGFEYVGSAALQYIANNWPTWSSRTVCVALMTPQHTLAELLSNTALGRTKSSNEIQSFIARRTRAYRVSSAIPEAALSGRDVFGCNVYASGETLYEENVFVRCWPRVLDWIEMCRFNDTFAEPILEVDAENEGAGVGSPRRVQHQLKVAEEVEMTLSSDGKLLEQQA